MSSTTVTNYLFKLDHLDSGFYLQGKPGAAEGLSPGALVDTQPEFLFFFWQWREAVSGVWASWSQLRKPPEVPDLVPG